MQFPWRPESANRFRLVQVAESRQSLHWGTAISGHVSATIFGCRDRRVMHVGSWYFSVNPRKNAKNAILFPWQASFERKVAASYTRALQTLHALQTNTLLARLPAILLKEH